MNRFSLILLSFISSLLLAEPLSQEAAIQKGSAASAALLQKLGGELKRQMQTGGPMAALRFCSQNALLLTDQVAKESGVSIKRVSLKNRNPANAASAEEQIVLNGWEKLQQSGQPLPAYEIKYLGVGEYTYYTPIVINNEACLKCHGDIAADSPLEKEIKAAYAEDKATGYTMGGLRGMIVIMLSKYP